MKTVKTILAIVVATSSVSAFAGLNATDSAAVDAYLSNYSNVPAYVAQTWKQSASTLVDVNNMKSGASYYDSVNKQVVYFSGNVGAQAPAVLTQTVNITPPANPASTSVAIKKQTVQNFKPQVIYTPAAKAPAYIAPNAPAYKTPVATPAAIPTVKPQTPKAPAVPSQMVINVPVKQGTTTSGANGTTNSAQTFKTTTIANTQATKAPAVITINGKDGVDGKDGAQGKKGVAGKDGITTTITKVDTATQNKVAQNTKDLNDYKQATNQAFSAQQRINSYNGAAINANTMATQSNAKAISHNSQRLDAVESHQKQQDETIKRNNKVAKAGVSSAMAQAGLHYTDSANSIAAGAGTYDGESAIAVGYSHQVGNSIRTSVQVSTDSANNFGASASIAVGW